MSLSYESSAKFKISLLYVHIYCSINLYFMNKNLQDQPSYTKPSENHIGITLHIFMLFVLVIKCNPTRDFCKFLSSIQKK